MSDGDIRNGPYASRAKEYVWSTLREFFPRGITPSDIDGAIEINWCFLYFEGKTNGREVEKGQGLFLRRQVVSMPPGKSVLVLGCHAALEKVDVRAQLHTVQAAWRDGDALVWGQKLPGTAMCGYAQSFVREAAQGHLVPSAWAEEWAHLCRPFTDEEAVA